jgi:hypothetical protein
MIRRVAHLLLIAGLLVMLASTPALAGTPHDVDIPFTPDCKGEPVPDMPGQGLAALFSGQPDRLPVEADPFASDSKTTIFEQYGYAGIRFNNYDLGCGPDAARDPSAVVGTAISNWMLQLPIALTALTGSLTGVAFQPTFLDAFDPAISKVSSALHESLFAPWFPVVLVVIGMVIIFKARRAALATSATAVGWSLLIVLLATALFRWPIQAGHLADETVTSTLGAAVTKLDGRDGDIDPGTTVASHVESAIFYRAWLSGTLGSSDSATAKKYGPELFDAQALTWREAATIEKNPDKAEVIVEAKQDQWRSTAEQIKKSSPEAYEYLTGRRSEARVGFAVMATLATFLALPFLLLSSLLLIGCFMIVRLAVMMFPAFATLGAFPAARGLVIGLGRTVGSAIVNSIVFGVGAGVTIMVLGLLFNPGQGTPGWLGLVLMPLFTFIMWKALRPFRRLTQMVSPRRDHFRTMAEVGDGARGAGRLIKKGAITAAGVYAGNLGAAATINAVDDEDEQRPAPHRAEADPTPPHPPRALPASPPPATPPSAPSAGSGKNHERGPTGDFIPRPMPSQVPVEPTEREWVDGEEVYTIYRPSNDSGDNPDDDAA